MTTTPREQADRTIAPRWLVERCRALLPDKTGHLVFWPVAVAGVVLDLWTKHAVFARLVPPESVDIIPGFLAIAPALNDGAAFGIAHGRLALLVGIAVLALGVILGVFLFRTTGRQRTVQAALGLFAAGVCGNLWDRLFNGGRVRDFIDVVYWPGKHWHTFNVADALLCIAVGLLVITTLFTGSSCRTRAPQQKSEH
jgi:signal peptidase II